MLSDLLTIDFNAQHVDKQFIYSLYNTGFAVIKNYSIPSALINEVYNEWKAFFSTPEKTGYLHDKITFTGYFPFRSENPKYNNIKNLVEFFHYRQGCKLPTNMSNCTDELYKALSSLGSVLLEWIENNLPTHIKDSLPMQLTTLITNSQRTSLRIAHYPPLTGKEEPGAKRSAPHEDINLLTILPAPTTNGLQVLDRKNEWHEVECDTNNIVVNTGEMLALLTQGYLRATTHRVVNPEGSLAHVSRLSTPLFLHPRDEIILTKGITAYDYLMERINGTLS